VALRALVGTGEPCQRVERSAQRNDRSHSVTHLVAPSTQARLLAVREVGPGELPNSCSDRHSSHLRNAWRSIDLAKLRSALMKLRFCSRPARLGGVEGKGRHPFPFD
jgi:hypothetical protein